MPVPPRREVHESRAERALPLPAPLTAVAELLDVVRGELLTAGRPLTDAQMRITGAALVVAYRIDTPPTAAQKAGFA